MRGIVKLAALLALFSGCREAPKPRPTVADLHFPVAVDYARGGVVLFADAKDLSTMSIGRLNATAEPPLIDSSFAIYTLRDLRSTHHWLWLMINPTGYTPVTFSLEHAPRSGIEAARMQLRTRLDEQDWRRDLDEARRKLAAAKTLAEMVTIVRNE